MQALTELEGEPDEEGVTFTRVRQAKRHRLWRVGHPFETDVAVRIVFWFESDRVVVALGFNKARLGDVWYASAATRAEALVDQWRRIHLGEEGRS